MGIFHEQIEFINRDCVQRDIVFDGQRMFIKPNYDENGNWLEDVHNFAPKQVAPYALNQNVVLGTEDPIDPSGFESYVVPLVKNKKGKLKFNIDFLPSRKNTAVTRVNLENYLDDPSLKVLPGRGTFKASEAALAGGRTGIANQSILDE